MGKGGVLKKRWGSAAQASRAHLSGLILRVPEAVHRGGGGGGGIRSPSLNGWHD